MKRLVVGLVMGALVMGSSATLAQEGGTLGAVQARGSLVCGVNGGLPGMSVLSEATGQYDGMDADFCRAVAAAVLGDPNAVEYRPLTADQRATAIQGGEVDVIFRNTTNTISRDAAWGDFGPTIFYDGQGMMVRADVGATTLEDLAGATICVTSGTTTELNLTDQMTFLGVEFTPVVSAEIDTVYGQYEEGRCDAVTSDRSQLVGRKSTFANPDDHVILDVVMSKEPLAPVVATGDNQWGDIVTWVVQRHHRGRGAGRQLGQPGRDAGWHQPQHPAPAGRDRRAGRPAGPLQRLRREGHRGRRQLRRDLRPRLRAGHVARARARSQRAVDERRADVLAALPLIDHDGLMTPGRRSCATPGSFVCPGCR